MKTLSLLITFILLYIVVFSIGYIWNVQPYIMSLASVILGGLILYYAIDYLSEQRYRVQLKK
jgi:isoprenylcysteine carboxyl methyltransferase (ICMT) family protein YpbQ